MKRLTLLLSLMLVSSVGLTIVALLHDAAVASAPGKQIGARQVRDSVAVAGKRAADSEQPYGNERTSGGLGLSKDEEMQRLKLLMVLMMSIGPRNAMR